MAPYGSQRRGRFKRGGIFSIQHRHQASARQVGRGERVQQLAVHWLRRVQGRAQEAVKGRQELAVVAQVALLGAQGDERVEEAAAGRTEADRAREPQAL